MMKENLGDFRFAEPALVMNRARSGLGPSGDHRTIAGDYDER